MGKIPKLKSNKKYTDSPRFSMIYSYEGEFKSNYSHLMKSMATEIATTMMKSIKG